MQIKTVIVRQILVGLVKLNEIFPMFGQNLKEIKVISRFNTDILKLHLNTPN